MIRVTARAITRALSLLAAVVVVAWSVDAAPAAQRPPAAATPIPGGFARSGGTVHHARSEPTRVVIEGVDLTGVGYDVGDPKAPIVMVELSDFGCPYCSEYARETFPGLEREFVATGKVFYKHVPFVLGMFPNSDRAARAAECAGEQGRFWPMHDSVYAHQSDWKRGSVSDATLRRLAGQVVQDERRWAACYAARRQHARTAAANGVARRLGVRATPTFFVNGRMVQGAPPLSTLRQWLTRVLDKVGTT